MGPHGWFGKGASAVSYFLLFLSPAVTLRVRVSDHAQQPFLHVLHRESDHDKGKKGNVMPPGAHAKGTRQNREQERRGRGAMQPSPRETKQRQAYTHPNQKQQAINRVVSGNTSTMPRTEEHLFAIRRKIQTENGWHMGYTTKDAHAKGPTGLLTTKRSAGERKPRVRDRCSVSCAGAVWIRPWRISPSRPHTTTGKPRFCNI